VTSTSSSPAIDEARLRELLADRPDRVERYLTIKARVAQD
jgi:hypothetical protein